MKNLKEFTFRVSLLLVAVILFFGGLTAYDKGDLSWATFSMALACSATAYSNVLEPTKRVDLKEAVRGRVGWDFTSVGFVLHMVSLALFALWLALLVAR